MTAQNGVPDLVKGWAAAEERNDAGALDGLLADGLAGVGPFGTDNSGRFRVTLVAVQEGEGWGLAHAHIGPLQGPPS